MRITLGTKPSVELGFCTLMRLCPEKRESLFCLYNYDSVIIK